MYSIESVCRTTFMCQLFLCFVNCVISCPDDCSIQNKLFYFYTWTIKVPKYLRCLAVIFFRNLTIRFSDNFQIIIYLMMKIEIFKGNWIRKLSRVHLKNLNRLSENFRVIQLSLLLKKRVCFVPFRLREQSESKQHSFYLRDGYVCFRNNVVLCYLNVVVNFFWVMEALSNWNCFRIELV